MPVKIHLENPLLGNNCYVGSNTTPLTWNLITGTTTPPPPYTPITGKAGYVQFKDNFEIAEITENELVDNTWKAPKATGCGGTLELLINPIINTTVGLPSEPGENSTTLENTIASSPVESVNTH